MLIVSHARIYRSEPIYPQRWGYWHIVSEHNHIKTFCGMNVYTSHDRKFDWATTLANVDARRTCKYCFIAAKKFFEKET